MGTQVRVDIQASDVRPGRIMISIATPEHRLAVALGGEDAFRFAHDMAKAYSAAFGDMLPKEYQSVADSLNELVATLEPKE
jgi:hypothetical protein